MKRIFAIKPKVCAHEYEPYESFGGFNICKLCGVVVKQEGV